jgi:CBS domain-containing protein
MRAQELMTRTIVTCHVNDSMAVAASKMWEHDCGALPVVDDEGKVTGIITDRDLCMAAYTRGRALDELLVNSAMSSHVISARAESTVGEVEHLMSKFQVRRIPILDEAGKPIGMISLNDLAIESARPETQISHSMVKIAHTLAAIGRPRRPPTQRAA